MISGSSRFSAFRGRVPYSQHGELSGFSSPRPEFRLASKYDLGHIQFKARPLADDPHGGGE